jgi:N-acetyl-1-D-myo-inositol-2-amino-2-deoxy-alpha-D-glucopyranoside deacetylase
VHPDEPWPPGVTDRHLQGKPGADAHSSQRVYTEFMITEMQRRARALWTKVRRAERWVARIAPRRQLISAVLLVGIAGITAFSLYLARWSAIPALFVADLADVSAVQRLLVIAPHCDDETISSAGLIQKVLRDGGQVRVVLVTNGDGSFTGTSVEFRRLYPGAADYIRAGSARQLESLAAMETLGVPPQDVIFLGYPDRGILSLWQKSWSSEKPWKSPFTLLTKSPYARTYNPQSVYSGESLLADLRSILRDFRPDTVVAPHPKDTHPDHWASGAFVALAIAAENAQPAPRLLCYLTHRADYPLPRGLHTIAPLLPPLRTVLPLATWGKVGLAADSRDVKGVAVGRYESQLALLGTFLRSFVRSNELFCSLAQPTPARLAPAQPAAPIPSDWVTIGGQTASPVMYDSFGETVTQRAESGADFVTLYAGQSDTELWIAAGTRGGLSRLASFTVLVRAIGDNGIRLSQAAVSLSIGSRPQTQAGGHFVLARFSLQDLGYPRAVVASVSSQLPGGKVADRIGWVLVQMEPQP